MSNRWNQYNFSTLHRLYIWGHRWNLVQTFKYQCCGFQGHFKSILVYNLKTKSDFWSKCPHYIMGYIINLGSMFFLLSLVLYLAYIDCSLCQIWSVYMLYLRCCDFSNKCLFLVNQQAEVLLNFFWWVYWIGPLYHRQKIKSHRNSQMTIRQSSGKLRKWMIGKSVYTKIVTNE